MPHKNARSRAASARHARRRKEKALQANLLLNDTNAVEGWKDGNLAETFASGGESLNHGKKAEESKILLLARDVQKLEKYLSSEMEKIFAKLKKSPSSNGLYNHLSVLAAAKIILFNKPRANRAMQLTVAAFNEKSSKLDTLDETVQCLSSVEKKLCDRLHVVKTVAKDGKTSPILLTPCTKKAMELLAEQTPNFIEGILTSSTVCMIQVFNTVAKNVQLENPGLLTDAELQEHVAFISQVIAMQDSELEWLTSHIANSLATEEDLHKISTLEMSKVLQFLHGIDCGQPQVCTDETAKSLQLSGNKHMPDGVQKVFEQDKSSVRRSPRYFKCKQKKPAQDASSVKGTTHTLRPLSVLRRKKSSACTSPLACKVSRVPMKKKRSVCKTPNTLRTGSLLTDGKDSWVLGSSIGKREREYGELNRDMEPIGCVTRVHNSLRPETYMMKKITYQENVIEVLVGVHACVFCDFILGDMKRHLLSRHKDEKEVIEALTSPVPTAFEELILWGDHRHNVKVLQKKQGVLFVLQQYRKHTILKKTKSPVDYIPCPDCLVYVFYAEFLSHRHRFCLLKKKEKRSSKWAVEKRKGLFPFTIANIDIKGNDLSHLATLMLSDLVTVSPKSDDLIAEYEESIMAAEGKKGATQVTNDRDNYHTLSSHFNKKSDSETLRQLLNPSKFAIIFRLIKWLCNPLRQEDSKPHISRMFASELILSLKTCASHLKDKARTEMDNITLPHRVEKYLSLFDSMSSNISVQAFCPQTFDPVQLSSTTELTEILPLTSDILKLEAFLNSEMQKVFANFKINLDIRWHRGYYGLLKITAAKVLLLNKPRAKDVALLKVASYMDTAARLDPLSDIAETLSRVEKKLCDRLVVVPTPNKDGVMVPILLTPKLKTALDLLLEARIKLAIHPGSPYVFSTSNYENLNVDELLQKFTVRAKLENPNFFLRMEMHKYIATACQIIAMEDNELDWIKSQMVDFTGDIYAIRTSAMEMARAVKHFCEPDGEKMDSNTYNTSEINVAGTPSTLECTEEQRGGRYSGPLRTIYFTDAIITAENVFTLIEGRYVDEFGGVGTLTATSGVEGANTLTATSNVEGDNTLTATTDVEGDNTLTATTDVAAYIMTTTSDEEGANTFTVKRDGQGALTAITDLEGACTSTATSDVEGDNSSTAASDVGANTMAATSYVEGDNTLTATSDVEGDNTLTATTDVAAYIMTTVSDVEGANTFTVKRDGQGAYTLTATTDVEGAYTSTVTSDIEGVNTLTATSDVGANTMAATSDVGAIRLTETSNVGANTVTATIKVEGADALTATSDVEGAYTLTATTDIEGDNILTATSHVEGANTVAVTPDVESANTLTATSDMEGANTFTTIKVEDATILTASPYVECASTMTATIKVEEGADMLTTASGVEVANTLAATSDVEGANTLTATPDVECANALTATSDMEGADIFTATIKVEDANILTASSYVDCANTLTATIKVEEGSDTLTTASDVEGVNTLTATSDLEGANTLTATSDVECASTLTATMKVEGADMLTTASDVEGANTLAATSDLEGANILTATPDVQCANTLTATIKVESDDTLTAIPDIEGAYTVTASPDIEGANTLTATTDVVGAADIRSSSGSNTQNKNGKRHHWTVTENDRKRCKSKVRKKDGKRCKPKNFRWLRSKQEVDAIQATLGSYIATKRVPHKLIILMAQEQRPILRQRTWQYIRGIIQHTIKNKGFLDHT